MRTPKELILSLISREVERAYRARDIAIDTADRASEKSKNTSKMLERALNSVDPLIETAEHWWKEASKKQQLFADIVREVDSAEDLHKLKQIVREMATTTNPTAQSSAGRARNRRLSSRTSE